MYFVVSFLLAFAVSRLDAADLKTVPAADCGINPVDIQFLLDASGSIKAGNFTIMLDFVKNFADAFDVGADKAQFGVTSFASTPANHFWLNTHLDKATLLPAISSIPYSQGGTYTAEALDFVRTNAFTAAHGNRPGVMDVLIVITDGQSADNAATLAAAKRVHQDNIIVLGVGVGSGFDANELQAIATDPSRFFHVDNFDALKYIQDQLQTKACEVCPFWSGKDAVFVDGKCVRFFDTPLKFAEAQAACKAEDPKVSLAELRSNGVREYIQAKTKEAGIRSWIGADDIATEGTFVWSNKGDVANIDPSWWGKGQPDNTNGNEDCVIMRPDTLLNDYACGFKQPYFCESVEVKVSP